MKKKILIMGLPGAGKTYLAVADAVENMSKGKVEKIQLNLNTLIRHI